MKYFIRLNRFQDPDNKNSLKKKRLKSLQKVELYLEPMRAYTMELFCKYSLLSISGTPDKWNFRLVKPISPVPWICINKPLLFYSDKWNPR